MANNKSENSSLMKYKILFIALLLILVSILLYFINAKIQTIIYPEEKKWITRIPFNTVADTLITTAIIGFVYEWFIRKENEKSLEGLIESVIFEPTYLRSFSETKLDLIIESSLKAKLGNEEMGNDVFNNLIKKTVNISRKNHNYRKEIILENFEDPDLSRYYRAIIDFRYRTKLNKEEFNFYFVDDHIEFVNFLHGKKYENIFRFNNSKIFNKDNFFTYFSINNFTIENSKFGKINLETESKFSDNHYSIKCYHPDLKNYFGKEVDIFYRRTAVIDKLGHCFSSHIGCPTKEISLVIDFHNTDIDYVNVFDFFMSSESPEIIYTPTDTNPTKIEISYKNWVFPYGGVIFLWVLKNEYSHFEH